MRDDAGERKMRGLGRCAESPFSPRRHRSMLDDRFDGNFIRRFYLDPKTAVASRVDMALRGRVGKMLT